MFKQRERPPFCLHKVVALPSKVLTLGSSQPSEPVGPSFPQLGHGPRESSREEAELRAVLGTEGATGETQLEGQRLALLQVQGGHRPADLEITAELHGKCLPCPIHSLDKPLLSPYYAPGSILDAEDTTVNKRGKVLPS